MTQTFSTVVNSFLPYLASYARASRRLSRAALPHELVQKYDCFAIMEL